jgi:hypothetical protein
VAVAVRERSGTWSAPWSLSAAGAAWSPALAADAQGGLWCTWDSWDGGRYRILVAHKAEQGEWSEPLLLSATDRPWLDLAPDVAAADGRAWVVWNRSAPWGRVNHRFNHVRSLHAAEVALGADALRPVVHRDLPAEVEQRRLPHLVARGASRRQQPVHGGDAAHRPAPAASPPPRPVLARS